MSDLSKYHHTTTGLAEDLGVNKKTILARARELGLGIDLRGRAGFRYSDEDVRKLEDSFKRDAPTPRRRRRMKAAV